MKVVTFGEVMLRIEPEGYYRFVQSDRMTTTFGGAEANVAVSLAHFGADSVYVTKLPAHEIGQCAVNALRRFGVNTSFITRGGNRVGIYFNERGASQRPSKCIYDRAGSAIAESSSDDFDWDRIFEGADWFHLTGITPALGGNLPSICIEACKKAKEKNIPVSIDLNYRSKLWTKEQAKETMEKIAPYAHVCVANEEDAKDVFGIEADDTDIENGKLNKNGYKTVAKKLADKYGFKKVAITLRTSINANINRWTALYYDGADYYFSREHEMMIVDRLGGGDSFCAGLIYSILSGKTSMEAVEFASAASCLKHSVEGDFNMVTAEEVERLAAGNASGRIQR
ncbi:sugar kinase [Treponema sp.]|uniref:sugar kinase n=1 Tax=Treponema sp. TaxID=166 RepID=UPI001DB3F13B|nr:sugar kinase [Treponema sp.]MBS7242192.1 sugar kinase [Treponema sp.]MDY4133575.1 sugar kinase [Treponema sp.]